VFAADIKGDLCGLGAAGNPQGKVAERIAGMPWLNHKPRPIRSRCGTSTGSPVIRCAPP
jgi:hypothetical protein